MVVITTCHVGDNGLEVMWVEPFGGTYVEAIQEAKRLNEHTSARTMYRADMINR